LKSTSEGSTLILTLSNPEHRNALGPEIYAAGVEALNAAENNSEIRSVVITGEGNTFCAGADLLRLQANRQNRQKFRRKVSRPCTAGLTLSGPSPNR
jgi:enoyl-CoA hydratase/carnithine racemase